MPGMSPSDPHPYETAPAPPAPAVAARPVAPRPSGAAVPPRRGGTLALAVLLGLVALGATGVVGWHVWQLEHNDRTGVAAVDMLQQRVDTLERALNGTREERNTLRQRMGDADAINRSLREEVLGVSERTRNLEDAVANLSEQTLTGHDAILLDEAESLLRMAKERYALFHDASSALSAYELADQTLAAVNDSAFSGVRQSLNAEREALAAVRPAAREADLATLARLRGQLDSFPLRPLDRIGTDDEKAGFWARAERALSRVVQIRRDSDAPFAVADGRIARELAMLDLAHAEAALLAYDDAGGREAIQRVDATLTAQFDATSPEVIDAHKQFAAMLAGPAATATPPQLGAALAELRNLRSVHALKPAAKAPTAAPAPAIDSPAGASSAHAPGAVAQ
jgi:uroporphyrin-III C-methyltransferase